MAALFFDSQDYQLLKLVNHIIEQDKNGERFLLKTQLHPNGIASMAMPRELRMAASVLRLLDSLHQSNEQERLDALQALRDMVLTSARTTLRNNTGRVLIQIMKELVRTQGEDAWQLRLAHDFRRAATGKPTVVRALLRRYHLLEMPEAWNQAVFDHHVHDFNTKGRKNATHLIMDAWIKGIRSLTVIYYNYVLPEAARELMRAAEIMGVTLRIGLLFHAPFRGRYIDFIWIPRGFADAEGFLSFLAEPGVRALMEDGKKASAWVEKLVLRRLTLWNERDRTALAPELGFMPEAVDEKAFLDFVGIRQTSLLHLAEFIHKCLYAPIRNLGSELKLSMEALDTASEAYSKLYRHLRLLDGFTAEVVLQKLEAEGLYPQESDAKACPEVMRLPPMLLLDWLSNLHSGNRIVLNLANLSAEEVLNLLWDCQGLITHLELFNLKDYQEGKARNLPEINDLQRAINEGSAPRLKQIIRTMLLNVSVNSAAKPSHALPCLPHNLEQAAMPDSEQRAAKLRRILRDIPTLHDFYKKTKLFSRLGTDSTSRSGMRYGMGLVFPSSLPPRAQRVLRSNIDSTRLRLPVHAGLLERVSWHYGEERPSAIQLLLRRIPGLRRLGVRCESDWQPQLEHTRVCNSGECSTDMRSGQIDQGNVFTLGGHGQEENNGLKSELYLPGAAPEARGKPPLSSAYINTSLANALKVLAGFLPALWAFHETQSWWVLVWLGAPIWFAITGLRNIVQAVLGGGGFRRSPFLRWNSYVSWSRLSDSLMYTGFSVILLEYLVRTKLLQETFGINAGNNQLLTFAVISLINGVYIAGHNYFRGLQKEAVVGNLFRSIFAIPTSIGLNSLLYSMLQVMEVEGAEALLLSSSAIVSKCGSDIVAGLIEGVADRNSNMRLRRWDYRTKLNQVFHTYAQLEIFFPEEGVLDMLAQPPEMLKALADMGEKARNLKRSLIINALDLMYFWYFQPRAPHALKLQVEQLTSAERLVLIRSQLVLTNQREVSQLFVDGLVGANFARPLSFYLDQHEEYLAHMQDICLKHNAL